MLCSNYIVCHNPRKEVLENLIPYIYVMVQNILYYILRNAPEEGHKSGRNTWEAYYVYYIM
jgi:hypothetical protein